MYDDERQATEVNRWFAFSFGRSRFQNRRAKEKRLKKDSGRRWPNVLRNGAAERKTTRMKSRKNQNAYQEEDTSNEGDTAVSYDGKYLTALICLSKCPMTIIRRTI
jgi:hypothetical protein